MENDIESYGFESCCSVLFCGVILRKGSNPDTSRYTKFGIIVASNAYGAPYGKNAHLRFGRDERFLLVEALPQSPQNTILCSENAGKFQRLRDFQIAVKVVCCTLQHKTLLNFTKDNGKIGVKYC